MRLVFPFFGLIVGGAAQWLAERARSRAGSLRNDRGGVL